MFDTVRLRTSGFTLNNSIINRYKNQIMTYYDNETMTESTRYIIQDVANIPHMRYYDKFCTLEIEVSIPKYLYGDNVRMVGQTEIDRFFTLLHQQLYGMFGIQVHTKKEWKCLRVDVCWNFQVGKQIHDYMRQLALMRFPRMNTAVYNQVESVIFQNKSNRIMFYDKECECRKKKCAEDVIERATGILRMEISPPVYKMKEYANARTAEDLLTEEYFRYVTSGVLPLLRFTMPDEFPSEWIKSHPISQIETALGFIHLYRRFGEGGLKQLFKASTLRNRMALVENIIETESLPPLQIDLTAI
jgi:hypothetical protein